MHVEACGFGKKVTFPHVDMPSFRLTKHFSLGGDDKDALHVELCLGHNGLEATGYQKVVCPPLAPSTAWLAHVRRPIYLGRG